MSPRFEAQPRPFPWGPVQDHMDRHGMDDGAIGRLVLGPCDKRVATQRGYRWRTAGALTEDEADRIATALGYHPSHLWGELWWSTVPDVTPTVRLPAVARATRDYERTLRARQRGPHRCAVDGCCRRIEHTKEIAA